MRIISPSPSIGFRIYAATPYTREAIYKAITSSSIPEVGAFGKLFADTFGVEQVLKSRKELAIRNGVETITKSIKYIIDQSAGKPPKAITAESSALSAEMTTALRLRDDPDLADILGPIKSRLDAVKALYEGFPQIKRLVDMGQFVTDETASNCKRLLLTIESLVPGGETEPDKPADDDAEGATGGTDKRSVESLVQREFEKIGRDFMTSHDSEIEMKSDFAAAIKGVAGRFAGHIAKHDVSREEVSSNLKPVRDVATLFCNAMMLAMNARTSDQMKAAKAAADALANAYSEFRSLLSGLVGTPIKKLMEYLSDGADRYGRMRMLTPTFEKFSNNVLTALRNLIASCQPGGNNVGCEKRDYKGLKGLLDEAEKDPKVLAQPGVVSALLFGGNRPNYGPGTMGTVEDVIRISLEEGKPPEIGSTATPDDVKVNNLLNYMVNYGQHGGKMAWDSRGSNCEEPTAWANPHVILFGSIVLWALQRKR